MAPAQLLQRGACQMTKSHWGNGGGGPPLRLGELPEARNVRRALLARSHTCPVAHPRPPAGKGSHSTSPRMCSHCSSRDRVSSQPRRAGSSEEGPTGARFSHLQGHPWGHGIPLGPSRLCHPEMTRGDMDRVNDLRRWESQTGVTGRGQPQKWSEVAGLMLLRAAGARGTLITPHFMSRKRKNTNLP